AARQEASLRFVPRQPNPQGKEQHQENSRSSLISAFSPFCSLIKSTKPVSEMLARRGSPCVTGRRRSSSLTRHYQAKVRCCNHLEFPAHSLAAKAEDQAF